MEEWKFTLLNGAISTAGAVLVGLFALYGVLRQSAKAYDSASKQAVALLQQVEKSAEAAREQTKWQLRRDTFAEMLIACERYEDAVDRCGSFLSDQYDEQGRVISNFSSEEAEAVTSALDSIRTRVFILRLEGPKELDPHIKEFLKAASGMYQTLHTWAGLLQEGRDSDYSDNWVFPQGDLIEAREQLFQAMYLVLHEDH
ncbi:hypothetical protein ACFZCF_07110 [Streptomyces sp. NPDC007945]|uniref:hypothetical protein n=1 Tax=Streptomyces sp. NPDC007945 TaxID=3364797 RepID=UPI0036E152C5